MFFVMLLSVAEAQQKILINNSRTRTTEDGKIVDAHDGRIIQFGKKFYWYGTAYGNTNGFTTANDYVCYSSSDLMKWKFEGKLMPEKTEGVYYRPHVVYNAKTKKYILWYNWYPKLWDGQFGVAESDAPTGPFKVVNDNVKVKQNALGVGDLGVFVDDDGKAFLSYNTIQGHKVSVEQLDETYTASTMQGSEFIAEHCEAGSMFKRNGIYYLLTDVTCCFCTQGSGARVYTAQHPLGPYSFRQNINRYPGEVASVLYDGNSNDNLFETFLAKQRQGMELWMHKETPLSSITIQQFTGNRSGQCGEVNNPITHQPILRHSFNLRYWSNGEWKEPVSKITVKQSAQQIIYTIRFEKINTGRLQVQPVFADTVQSLLISEVELDKNVKPAYIFKTGGTANKPIIPAQQTFVMPVQTTTGIQYIWMGDLWGSASDNIKGHDYQFWSKPLEFYKNGLIKPLEGVNSYQLILNK